MPNIKLIAVTVTALSISTILYLSSQQSEEDKVLTHVFSLHANDTTRSRRNLATGINPAWMGGGLEMGDGPWNEGNMLQLFSSTPGNPRQYTGSDTEFIHYKNVTEKDGYGSTTFPPTESPTQMQLMSGGELPTLIPTEGYGGAWTREPVNRFPTKFYDDDDDVEETHKPSKKPSKEPTHEPTKEPTSRPSKRPSKLPTKLPTREPTNEPSPGPSKRPTKLPTRLPTKLPTREPTKEPTQEPSPGPSNKPTKLPTRKPSKEPSKEPTHEPTNEPTKEPTPKPFNGLGIVTQKPSPYPTEKKTAEGSFYCGTSVYIAQRTCTIKCPNGHSDCPLGEFCYAVECDIMDPNAAIVTESPTREPTTTPTQSPSADAFVGDDALTDDFNAITDDALSNIDDFYCGNNLEHASSECIKACPTGSPTECPDNLKCYASTGCKDVGEPGQSGPSRSPTSFDASNHMYCGTSFMDASKQCLNPCPSGLSSECPPDQACYANTPCSDKGGFFCGTSIVNASASCQHQCESGMDSECPGDMSCFYTETCKEVWEPSKAPTPLEIHNGTKFCGFDYEHAASQCTQPCPSGLSSDCPDEMSCYSQTPCAEKNTFFCGVSWNNAASSCKFPCPSGSSDDCPPNTYCYAYTTCDETDSFMCGKTFEDASNNCDEPCPSGSSSDCPTGMSCFTHTTCASRSSPDDDMAKTDTMFPTTAPVVEYIPGDSFFCGTSFLEASSQCTHPCPTRLDSECPDGEKCYGNTPCPTRDTYYCGANLDEASAVCQYPCPSGSSQDCPTGLSCFAFTTCADKDTFYCGSNYIEAGENCDLPCSSALSSECPDGLTCFAHTMCGINNTETEDTAVAPTGPTDSYFCGASFDDASRDCSLPCPSGSTKDCPLGMSCYSHTSCADRDSFMCGVTWEDAASKCSDPCPTGEHSTCPEGMKCFAYTPCNNRGSYFCGYSEDEASNCLYPCTSGDSSTCPNDMSCFSYTTCGTGDFNTKAPSPAPIKYEFETSDSFFCGRSFEEASADCEIPCISGSSELCPEGLSCFEYTTCVGRPEPFDESDTFYCGVDLVDANEKCLNECPSGSSNDCPSGESCIPFTSCNDRTGVPTPTPETSISSTFFCGKSKEDADASCTDPCPSGLSEECPDPEMSCYSFTTCSDKEKGPIPDDAPIGGYCGTSFEDATDTCSKACSLDSQCPEDQSCYGYTSCDDRDTFYCGKTWDEASATCGKSCPSGKNEECDDGDVCFGYTPCNDKSSFFCGSSFDDASSTCTTPCSSTADCASGEACFPFTTCNSPETDMPIESFYCGATFEEASMSCTTPCPSGKHSDCPDDELCYPYTPCAERDSYFCGLTWTDASTSCHKPCPTGSSSECPDDEFCFPSTPCDETESFYCGMTFEDATATCGIPCPNGQSSSCPLHQGCFAYTLCEENGDSAIITPTLAPIPEAPLDSYYCGTSYDEASTKCGIPCPSKTSLECPDGEACFASTPCSDKESFFCGNTWEEASSTCKKPCETNSDCDQGDSCFGYTPCSKTETFFCGASFDEASTKCSDPCPSGEDIGCKNGEKCFKYTPCGDIHPSDDDDRQESLIDESSLFCGNDFTDASTRCYLPCPSGSASECPVGEACYSTPCGGGDSFFCGTSWYDASSECKVACPSGLDDDCPEGSKCFGYTPCSNSNSFYCGVDFYDASTNCVKPCPGGSSSECPEGTACFPNTPCESDNSSSPSISLSTGHPSASPITAAPSTSPVKITVAPTPSPSLLMMMQSVTDAPVTSMFLYCGSDVDDVNCELPCDNGDECPLGYGCYATNMCKDSFYCGETFADANSTCAFGCEDGRDESCPPDMKCFAQTSCADRSPIPPIDVHQGFCGTSWNHASSNCLFPCESSDDCPGNTSCFPYTACDKNESFMCGTSFDDASSCTRPCPSGSTNECDFGESCFTQTTCGAELENKSSIEPGSFYCGSTFDDASKECAIPCPDGSSKNCPQNQACFANTPCQDKESFFCGISWEDASESCAQPCEANDDCDVGECFGYTSCTKKDTFYCGLTFDDASSKCSKSCPSGEDQDCENGEKCFKYTSCSDPDESVEIDISDDTIAVHVALESYFCGFDFEDASTTCTIPCPTKSNAQCPLGQQCFAHTTCAGTQPSTYYCGKDIDDAQTCSLPCFSGSSKDCPEGFSCYGYTTCIDVDVDFDTDDGALNVNVNFESDNAMVNVATNDTNIDVNFVESSNTDMNINVETEENIASMSIEVEAIPTESYFCGTSYDDASESCAIPCAMKTDDECPGNLKCFPFTPCAKPGSFFCGHSFDEASESCTIPCPSGKSNTCPSGESCYAYTTCKPTTESPTPKPTFPPVAPLPTKKPSQKPSNQPTNVPSRNPVTAFPTPRPSSTPTRRPTAYPTERPTPRPTPFPTNKPTSTPTKKPTVQPTKSPIIPVVFEVPEDSFYCGVTFDHASQLCGVACPNGNDDCPPGMNCFGNTPCGERNSFFCGVTYGDANEKCTIPCPSGSANECPNGESCFAFTMCKPITETPTEIPTEYPTRKPTPQPTPKPTSKPTNKPTKAASNESTYVSIEEPVDTGAKEQPLEMKEEGAKQEEKEKEPEEEEDEDNASALVIELKPCDDPLAMTVNQAYWRSWSTDRPETCNRFEPSDIEDETYTHLVYSFASISAAGLVEPWVGSWDEVDKYKEFNKVKDHNPDVKTIIAVTEGIFYGAGMNPVTFNEVVMTEESRIAFAQSVPAFLSLYDFDGIEIDWDTPLDPDKGGDPDNFEKLPLLMKEIRNAIEESGEDYLLTFALPATDWELLDFDIETLAESVDWFNLMSFDYHTPKNIPKTVGAHTDLKMIDYVVTDLVKNTASTKFVLGMAAFGRTYTLADDRCKELGCPFRTPGLGGCGNTPGFLPFAEISEFIEDIAYDELHQDVSSSSMVAVVNDDQMISYDDETTWAIKEAYAEMMCLRGVMLWSVDMLKAPSFEPQKRRMNSADEKRNLITASTTDAKANADSVALEGSSLLGCDLCEGFKVLSGTRVEYAGSEVSCGEIESMLNTVHIAQESDQCTGLHSTYQSQCCAKAPSKPCDLCGTDKIILESKQVHYSGEDSTCGTISTTFLQMMETTSFTCSLAKTSLKNFCCAEACQLCNTNDEINSQALIELDGNQVTCEEYESSLKEAGYLNGSGQCATMVSSFSNVCCSSKKEVPVEVTETAPAVAACDICHRDDIHHELRAEAMVEYKGTSLSCVDVNSLLAKSEHEGSEMCDATQSILFSGCCYEKCSLCGDQALKWDATVKYNNQILSCDEFSQLFSMNVIDKSSKQCDAMQAAYSPTCCYKPPTTPCNLCKDGVNLYELNTHAFVKTRSGSHSTHCKALSTNLLEREEENSQQCLESKAEFFESCCNTNSFLVGDHQPSVNWNTWIADYMAPSSSGVPLKMSFWTLLMVSLIGFAFLFK